MGSSTEDIIAFLDSLPKSHLSLDRKHFTVIDKTLETDGAVWCYRNKDWGNDEELEDYPAAQLGRRGLTRFALSASHAAGTLYPMLKMGIGRNAWLKVKNCIQSLTRIGIGGAATVRSADGRLACVFGVLLAVKSQPGKFDCRGRAASQKASVLHLQARHFSQYILHSIPRQPRYLALFGCSQPTR